MERTPQTAPKIRQAGDRKLHFSSHKTPLRRKVADQLARAVVNFGGFSVILSILGIFVFILVEVWPLLLPAEIHSSGSAAAAAGASSAVLSDEYCELLAVLDEEATLRVIRLAKGEVALEHKLTGGDGAEARPLKLTRAKLPTENQALTACTDDGRAVFLPLSWRITFDMEQKRTVTPEAGDPVWVKLDPAGRPLRAFTFSENDEEGKMTVAGQLADGRLVVERITAEENMMTGAVERSTERFEQKLDHPLTDLIMGIDQQNLYGGTGKGELLWWQLDADGEPGEPQVVGAGPSAVTAMTLLIGARALVVGQASGALSVWFRTRREDGELHLTRVRDFPSHGAPIRLLSPSKRRKSFWAQDENGGLGFYYSTSERTLWKGPSPMPEATAIVFAPKEDAFFLYGDGRVQKLEVQAPHPEVSAKALFGKVWYEGYRKEEYVWQSSAATDEFEPKLSMTPLIGGTLKGTFYSLILAVPLAILGAMYTSQFMHPSLQRYIKPSVEIMAALPSVVLGFLAGLWLAPLIEDVFCGLLLMVVIIPLFVVITGLAWEGLPGRWRNRFPEGAEMFPFVAAITVGMLLASKLGVPFEEAAFGGSFPAWLADKTGWEFEQRNAVIIGIAMGFAVIPIIFAISEDALSNVPRHLISGSLALGANRWQTVVRVVLPTASPGIFSAIMVGFGRAVGETMIVLMATGNTPILDWNPFNGFRTLSANIAVEIPEAPHGGTLYRVLFLSGLLLFFITFFVNTLAEFIRHRLREKYAKL